MEVSNSKPLNCIKANAKGLVKFASGRKGVRVGFYGLLLLGLVFLPRAFTLAADPDPSLSPTPGPSPTQVNGEEPLPEIEAKTYPLTVLRKSSSNKIYLFDDLEQKSPPAGRILLLKKGDEPAMAFRVLKNYGEKKMIAAKRIKKYNDIQKLQDGDSFTAIEKISDLVPPTPTAQDQSDLDELENQAGLNQAAPNASPSPDPVPTYDPDLDSANPVESDTEETEENKKPDPVGEVDLGEDTDNQFGLTLEETRPIDHFNHWVTAGFGFVRNNGPPAKGGSYWFSSGNLRYGLTVGKMLFLDKINLQDSITVETGFYLYKSINFAVQGDAYTILSLPLVIRYNLLFSEKFGVFVYAGFNYNRVISNATGNGEVQAALTNVLPSGGGGLLFQLGPSWYTRVDLGIDTIGLNLLLKF